MWGIIAYIAIAGMAGAIFKFLAAIIDGLSMSVFGLHSGKIEENIMSKPRRFFAVLVIKNTIIGLSHAYLILYTLSLFLLNSNVPYWLLVTLSIIWSLFILQYSGITPWIYFFTSTIGLVSVLLGFGLLSLMIIGLLTVAISLPFHFGRINVLLEQHEKDFTQ